MRDEVRGQPRLPVGGEAGLEPENEQLSTSKIVALHLIPGASATLAYWLLIDPLSALGYPPLAALLAAVIAVLLPFELGVLAYTGRQWGVGLWGAVAYRNRLPRRVWWSLVPLLVLVGIAASAVGMFIERPLQDWLARWLPEWLASVVVQDTVATFDRSAWIATLAMYFLVNVILGPVVEEMYFRGYLLPRMQRFGRWAPLINTGLFSLYHFWSPAQLLSRIGAVAPFAYAVQRKRSIYLGMAVHIVLNAISVATLSAVIFSSLP